MRGKGTAVAAAVILLFLFGFSAPLYGAEVIKLKFANYFPVVHKNTAFGQEFCDEIKKRTGGRVEISYYAGGTLLTAPKMAAGVNSGIADIGLSQFLT
jgi:TRAP-type transport system periplasmic protein